MPDPSSAPRPTAPFDTTPPVARARGPRTAARLAGAMVLALLGPVAAPPVAAAGPAVAAAPSAAERAALIDTGRRTYVGLCARCHGANLAPPAGHPDLRRFPAADRARFEQVVREGRGAMPAIGRSLSAVQVDGLWAYVGSVAGR